MPEIAATTLFVAYDNDPIAKQALTILRGLGYNAYILDVGVPPPPNSVCIFSSKGMFASTFLATVPEQYERRGIQPPQAAQGTGQLLAVKKTHDGRLYAKQQAENLTVALENFVGYERKRPLKARVNRLEKKRQRKLELHAELRAP